MTQDAAAGHFPLYRPSRSLEQFQTRSFLRIEFIAVRRCARKSTGFASESKIVGENRGEMENFLGAQDSTHEGSAEHSRCTCVEIDLHALIMTNFEHRVLRIEPINTAVQRCASRSTEFASR